MGRRQRRCDARAHLQQQVKVVGHQIPSDGSMTHLMCPVLSALQGTRLTYLDNEMARCNVSVCTYAQPREVKGRTRVQQECQGETALRHVNAYMDAAQARLQPLCGKVRGAYPVLTERQRKFTRWRIRASGPADGESSPGRWASICTSVGLTTPRKPWKIRRGPVREFGFIDL